MRVPELLKNQLRSLLRTQRLSLCRVDQLTSLAVQFGSDKGTLFDAHGYTRVYSRLFDRLRTEAKIGFSAASVASL